MRRKGARGSGQVEDVATLREARQRGLARAVVSAAIAASREAGHEHTCIAAVADDWPQLLYARLGFEPVGRFGLVSQEAAGHSGVALRPASRALRKSRFEPASAAGWRYLFGSGSGPHPETCLALDGSCICFSAFAAHDVEDRNAHRNSQVVQR